MKSVFVILAVTVPLFAQLQDNTERQLACSNRGNDNDRPRHCEMREHTFASIGSLNINAGPNGGATIKGWSRGDVLVRARIEAAPDPEAPPPTRPSRVLIEGSGGQVRATGPEPVRESWWSVTYE